MDDYRTVFANASSRARAEFADFADAAKTVEALTSWILWLRKSHPRAVETASEFFSVVRDDSGANPLRWCEAQGVELSEEIQGSLKEASDGVSVLGAYVFGRAAMEASLSEPVGTAGLTLPYRVLEDLEPLGIGFAGADDALLGSNLQANVKALREIDREIARVAENPAAAAKSYDRRELLAAVRIWRDASGLEQAVNTRVYEILVDIFPLSRILVTIAVNAPEIAASRLEALGNPGFVQTVLDQIQHDTLILSLLKYAPAVFDSAGKWNRCCVARLLLDAFEAEQLGPVRAVGPDRAADDVCSDEPDQELQNNLAALAAVLLKRADGPHLAVEWVAHLLRETVVREPTEMARGKPSKRFRRMVSLLNGVINQFGNEAWAEPILVWNLFGGRPAAFPNGAGPHSPDDLPAWCDMIGQKDAVATLAVAALLARMRAFSESQIVELTGWLSAVVSRMEGEPELLWLSSFPSSILLSVLAWVVICTKDPADWLASAWRNADEARLRARFYRTDEGTILRRSRGTVDPVAEKMNYCSAIIDLGAYVLRGLTTRDDQESLAPRVARLLQDMIDEFRYCFPPLLLGRDSRLIGALSVGAAVAGILMDPESLASFVARYRGDDDALVAVIANAAANGVPPKTIAVGLASLGIEFRGLPERWIGWKRKQSHEVALLSPVIEQLKRVCES